MNMTQTDLLILKGVLLKIKTMGILSPGKKVAIHSPWKEQYSAMKEVFGDGVTELTQDDWDIKKEKLEGRFGLLVFCNVFMYIDQPAIAFENVLSSCNYLIVQDIIKRDRGPLIFGIDGDCMRYEYGSIKSNYEKAFDISKAGEVIDFIPYKDNKEHLHFIAIMKKFRS
jgi:hypothetical protein